ncbi:protein phosphatase inhibitor 2 family member C [Choloepus didactylus]|uniref:protein phosphatase inhibitor 2 family member C n=1 Tax=Choloepus didactylus TaxID=27675 RepID=UPI00189FA3AB|nr:protein phosphatase inhibitor 2 family member C [Choloepus didactylus]
MAASAASQRPIKGILKNKTSAASSVVAPAEQPGGAMEEAMRKKSQKWDESNILATYRPACKDYGLMKMNKPSTPYLATLDDGEDPVNDSETWEATTPDLIAKKRAASETSEPKAEEQESTGEENLNIPLDKEEKRRQFEMKRKLHYNEGLNIKFARQLISKDLQAEEDENEESPHAADEESTAAEDSKEDSNEGSTSD